MIATKQSPLARLGMSPVWWQVAHAGGARAVGLVMSTLTLAISARYLGPDGRGIVAAAYGWVAVMSVVGGLSLGQVVIHLAAGKDRDAWLPSILGSLLIIVAVVTAVVWGGVVLSYFFSSGSLFNHLSPGVLVIAFVGLPILIWSDLGLNLLLALDGLKVFNVAQVVGSILQLIAMTALVVILGLGVRGALAAMLVSQSVIVGTCLTFVYRRAPAIRIRLEAVGQLLKGSAKLHLSAIGTVFFTQTNVILVNYFCRPEDTGYYQLATQLIMVLQLLPVSMSMVAYTLVARDGPNAAWPEQRRMLIKGVALTLVASAAAYLTSPWLVRLLAGQRFMPAVPLFRLMLPTLVGVTMSMVMASQWIGRGLFLQAAGLTFATGVLAFAGNIWLLPRIGVLGAVYTTLGVYGLSIVGNGSMAYWVERRWRVARGRTGGDVQQGCTCA
jgi:antigen flippase